MRLEFYLKKPDSEENDTLNAICSNMIITRNENVTFDMLTISDDFCGDPPEMQDTLKLITSLRDNIETPSIYALYLFEYYDEEDDDDEDEVEIQVLAVITFAISAEYPNTIKIITLCSNQSPIGYGIKGCGIKIITFLFNAVQQHVNKINQEMHILLTPVKSAIGFYEKVGMKLLSSGDMIKKITPMLVPLRINGNSEFNELSESNNYVDIVNYIVSQGAYDRDMPRRILNKIWEQNRRNPRLRVLFDNMQIMSENGIIGPKYQKYYTFFLSKSRGVTKKKRRNLTKRRKRSTKKIEQ